ncbi:hypothetical protein BDE36_3278 [Arcticibacter tournemirensis]|nr:hypothetical protein BDE36_3278 [Arcticibacter tournemirensis]
MIALSNDVELWNSMEVTQSLGNMIDKKNIISSFFLSTANQFSCENRLKRKKDNSNLDINNAWLSILVCPSCYKYHFDPEMIDDWIDDTDLFYDNSKLINNDYRYLIGGGLQLLKLI